MDWLIDLDLPLTTFVSAVGRLFKGAVITRSRWRGEKSPKDFGCLFSRRQSLVHSARDPAGINKIKTFDFKFRLDAGKQIREKREEICWSFKLIWLTAFLVRASKEMSVGKLPLVWVVGVLAVCCWIVSGLSAGSREVVQLAADAHLHPLSRLAVLQQVPSRLMASKAMTTFVVYRTTIPTCSFTTSCAMINGAVTACRRLDRDVDIDAILPNKPVKLKFIL